MVGQTIFAPRSISTWRLGSRPASDVDRGGPGRSFAGTREFFRRLHPLTIVTKRSLAMPTPPALPTSTPERTTLQPTVAGNPASSRTIVAPTGRPVIHPSGAERRIMGSTGAVGTGGDPSTIRRAAEPGQASGSSKRARSESLSDDDPGVIGHDSIDEICNNLKVWCRGCGMRDEIDQHVASLQAFE